MKTGALSGSFDLGFVLEAYRLDRYENLLYASTYLSYAVLEAYRLDRYENL